MDEDGIAMVLARASELRSKITNCIHNSSNLHNVTNEEREPEAIQVAEDDDEDGDETLLNIRDAFESLEAQLSSLQALQQQQWYEKGAALAEIDNSRKKLLTKLQEYKGQNYDVIQEAAAFASETVDENSNDLLLPPYPTRPINNTTHYPTQKAAQNGPSHQSPKSHQVGSTRSFIYAATKAIFTVIGVVCVLSLTQKRGTQFEVLATTRFPPPAKERVEIPFDSGSSTPDVSYGCG